MRAALVLLLLVPSVTWAADKGEVKLGGRLFTAGKIEAIDGQETLASADVRSLRLEADWRWTFLRAVGEIEVAKGEAELKDAYVRARMDQVLGRFDAAVGRKKAAFSRMTLASSWDLPIVRRGMLDQALSDRALIGGRSVGAHFGAELKRVPLHPGAYLSVTQAEDASGAAIPDAGKIAARVEAKAGFASFGVATEARQAIARPEIGVGTWMAFEADAEIEREMAGFTWRGWLEATTAKTWIDTEPLDGDDAWLVAAQLLLAARLDGKTSGREYVEAFAFFQLLEPDAGVTADIAWEVGGGLNVGMWKRARLQLQAERWAVDRNTPTAYGLVEQTVVMLQAGVAF